jgi:hypothetical protein
MSTTYMALAQFAEDTAANSNQYRKLPIHMSRFHSELCNFPLTPDFVDCRRGFGMFEWLTNNVSYGRMRSFPHLVNNIYRRLYLVFW